MAMSLSFDHEDIPIDLSEAEHVDGHQKLQLDLLQIRMIKENLLM